MSNFQNTQSLRPDNHGIVTNDNGDAVRIPREQHQAMNPNIGTNEHGDYVKVPQGANNRKEDTNKFEILINYTANSRTYPFEVMSTTTVGQLKDMIEKQLDVAKTQQKLTYAGKNLGDDETLSEFKKHKKATIDLVARVRGG